MGRIFRLLGGGICLKFNIWVKFFKHILTAENGEEPLSAQSRTNIKIKIRPVKRSLGFASEANLSLQKEKATGVALRPGSFSLRINQAY